eukprot:5944182-Pyramimonas_sp.AAC.1
MLLQAGLEPLYHHAVTDRRGVDPPDRPTGKPPTTYPWKNCKSQRSRLSSRTTADATGDPKRPRTRCMSRC